MKTAAVACLLAITAWSASTIGPAWAETNAPASASDRPILPLEHTGQIKSVFQVSKDEMQEGVHKALFALRKMHKTYVAAGVDPKRLDLRAVFHGDAAVHTLTDAAWNRVRNETGGNPNSEILREFAELGVSIELCDSRRMQNGWSKEDVYPSVLLAPNAYQRLIDLQLRGYAYIRF